VQEPAYAAGGLAAHLEALAQLLQRRRAAPKEEANAACLPWFLLRYMRVATLAQQRPALMAAYTDQTAGGAAREVLIPLALVAAAAVVALAVRQRAAYSQ